MLELHKPGAVTLKAEYEGLEVKSLSRSRPILETKVAQSIRPVNIVTDLHQEPSLPSTVTVEYDKGFPKAHKVTWQAIPKKNSTTIKPFKF